MRIKTIIPKGITLIATTLFLALSLIGTGYATQEVQETTVETSTTYTTDSEILVESGIFTETTQTVSEDYLAFPSVAEAVSTVGSSSGESSAEFTCWAQQRVIEGSVSAYLSEHPELNPRDLMGVVDHNHPLVANQVIAEAYKCPHTNTYYRITSDGTVKGCSSHGYLIGNY